MSLALGALMAFGVATAASAADPVGNLMGKLFGNRPTTSMSIPDATRVKNGMAQAQDLLMRGDPFRALQVADQQVDYARARVRATDGIFVDILPARANILYALGEAGGDYLHRADTDLTQAIAAARVNIAADHDRIGFLIGTQGIYRRSGGDDERAKEAFADALSEFGLAGPKATQARMVFTTMYGHSACASDDVARCGSLLASARQMAGTLRNIHVDDRVEIDGLEAVYALLIGDMQRSVVAAGRVMDYAATPAASANARTPALLEIAVWVLHEIGDVREVKRLDDRIDAYAKNVALNPSRAMPDDIAMVPGLWLAAARGEERRGRLDLAIKYTQQSLAFLKMAPQVRATQRNFGDAQAALGRYYSRQGNYRDSRTALLATRGKSSCAHEFAELALVEAHLKDVTASNTAIEQFVSSLARGGACGSEEWQGWASAARAMAQLDNRPAAVALGKRAIVLIDENSANLRVLDLARRQDFMGSRQDIYSELAGWLAADDRLAEAGQVLDLLKRQELQDFVRRSKAQSTSAGLSWRPNETRALESLRKSGASRVPEFLAQLKQAGGAASPSPSAAGAPRAAEDVIVRIWHDGSRLRYLLRTADGLHAARSADVAADDLRLLVSSFTSELQGDETDAATEGGKKMHGLLWEPLQAQLDKYAPRATRIALDVGGNLRNVPFAALWDGKQFVVERYSLWFVGAGSGGGADASRRPRHLAAFAGGAAGDDATALTHARAEARDIVGLVGGDQGGNRAFLDKAFTRDSFTSALTGSDYSRVHVASHFRLPQGSARSASLSLGDGNDLRADELQAFDLRGVDLIVLSACDTAAPLGGTFALGSELESAASMLRAQGARTVVASLWVANDYHTPALMRAFYENLGEVDGPAAGDALRKAQLALLRGDDVSARAPRFWGPFVVIGSEP